MSRERVMACATRLLDRGFFRVGSEAYAEQNGTVGLATIEKGHVTCNGNVVTFDYPAKGMKQRVQSVVDQHACDVVRALKRRRRFHPDRRKRTVEGFCWWMTMPPRVNPWSAS